MTETSTPRLQCFKASHQDHERLLKLYAEKSREGKVQVNLDMSPDIFEAISVEGYLNEVFAVEDAHTGEIAGAGVRNLRKCFINGQVQTVGYLSGLRVAEKYRSTRAMFLLFKKLRELYLEGECFAYLTSVFNSNMVARKMLVSDKAGMPHFREMKQFNTYVFKPGYLNHPKYIDFETEQLKEEEIPELVIFLQKEGAKYQFFPYLEDVDFICQRNFLKNLAINDIYIARKHGRITGCLAFINQTDFRRWNVDGYSPIIKYARGVVNLGLSLSGLPLLPPEQQSFNYRLLSLVCIENNDAEVFRALFNRAVCPLLKHRKSLISVSLFDGSPFIPSLPLLKLSFKSTIFIGYWDETYKQVEALDGRYPHLEAASL